MLVIVILLCSIVCSVTNVFGRVIPAQATRIVKKESMSTQLSTQLAEKVESETKTDTETKYQTSFFVIQTVVELFRFDIESPGSSGLVHATRWGRFRNLIPLYLVERTIRI
jgi:hypothetical protein